MQRVIAQHLIECPVNNDLAGAVEHDGAQPCHHADHQREPQQSRLRPKPTPAQLPELRKPAKGM